MDAPAIITNLPPEAAREFLKQCPTAQRVILDETYWGTRWGIGVTFNDGAQHAVRKWCFTQAEKDRFIAEAGPILYRWWRQKRFGT